MDLHLYLRVLARFKYVVLLGLLLAVGLTFLTLARVNLSGKPWVAYRQPETFQATSTVLVTQRGFPLGSTSVATGSNNGFSAISVLYAQLINSDVVRAIVRQGGPLSGQYLATAAQDPKLGTLPVVNVTGLAPTPGEASRMAARVTLAFKSYMKTQQEAAGIPPARKGGP